MSRYTSAESELIEKLARELAKSFHLGQGVVIDWAKVSEKERAGWIAAAQWTYDNVWSFETVVYFD